LHFAIRGWIRNKEGVATMSHDDLKFYLMLVGIVLFAVAAYLGL